MSNRRLAGILAADVVSYSAQMGADDTGTLARVRALRTGVIEPLAAEHGGRLFKTMGDGFLLEFASAVQALRCAIAIQTALNAQPDGLRLRIGVHQGEVVAEGGDLFGDGVIVAARLEPLAEHGGIVISSRVKEDAAGKVPLDVEDLGEPPLKNIAAKVHAFRVRLTAPADRSPPALALPDKPSIAVLPFHNMSGDPDQEYFSDGVAEDIVTQLSRGSGLFVIARGSSFSYKGRSADVKQIGRDLGVRYVLEGSVRRAGDRVRITARLSEAETGNHLWAERYDRSLADVFAVQDEISDAVAVAIGPAVADAEIQRAIRRPPQSLGAWDLYQQGIWHLGKVNAVANEEARGLFQKAVERDPLFAAAYVRLSWACGVAAVHYRSVPYDEGVMPSVIHARQAVALDPGDAEAHAGLSIALTWSGDMEGAEQSARRALSINHNCAQGHLYLGPVLAFTARTAEARAALATFERLSPRDSSIPDANIVVIQSYYFDRDFERCLAAIQRSISAYPEYLPAYNWLAPTLGQLGRNQEARAALDAVLVKLGDRYNPGARPRFHRPEDHALKLEGLRKAGWKE